MLEHSEHECRRSEAPLASAHDAASRTFWRNVAARGGNAQAALAAGQTGAFGPSPVVWEVSVAANPAPFAANIPTGLAPARRPRSEPLAAFSRAKDVGKETAQEAAAAAEAGSASATAAVKIEDKDAVPLPLPGADLPPVIAPSRCDSALDV